MKTVGFLRAHCIGAMLFYDATKMLPDFFLEEMPCGNFLFQQRIATREASNKQIVTKQVNPDEVPLIWGEEIQVDAVLVVHIYPVKQVQVIRSMESSAFR